MSQVRLKIAVMSDLHFMAWKESLEPVEWVPQLHHALQDIASLEPDFLVINGDLTNGKVRDYDLAMRTLTETIHCPIYFTMGNHEYYGFHEPDDYPQGNFSIQAAQERFLAYTRQSFIYYHHIIQDTQFIFLSTEHYALDLCDAGWLSDAQLNWFQSNLQNSDANVQTIVFFHQPVDGTVANSDNTCAQSDKVREILQQKPGTLFVTGHTHQRMDQASQLVNQDGTWYVGGGTVCNDLPQSRWIEITDDNIRLRIRDHRENSWISEYDAEISYPSRV